MDIGKFVDRRLHPVRLVLDVLRNDLDGAGNAGEVTLDRKRLLHMTETLAMFVEDFELSHRAQRESAARGTAARKPAAERAEEA